MPNEVTADEIQPAAAAAPATAPAPETPAKEDEGGLPDELLQEVPALQLLMHGSPPATVAAADADFPELKTVKKHLKDLAAAGFGIYQTADKARTVVFNGLFLSPEDVKAADEAGTLDQIATPYEELRAELSGEAAPSPGGAAPASETAGGVPTPSVPSGSPSGPPAPAGSQKKLTSARIAALAPGSPTSGPAPGQGRLLNSLLKPVV